MALGLVGLALCVLAYFAFLDGAHVDPSEAAFATAFLFAFTVAGLVVWERRPANPLGLLLTAFAFADIGSAFQHSDIDVAFTVGYALVAVPILVLGHLALAYPTGRLESRVERRFLAAAYAIVVAVPLARLAVYDPDLQPVGINGCERATETCAESVIAVAPSAGAFSVISKAAIGIFVFLAVVVVALAVRRFAIATRRRRRLLAPVLAATTLLFTAIVVVQLSELRPQPDVVERTSFIVGGVAQAAVVAMVVVGMLRTRLGQAAVGEFLVGIERTPPDRIRDALAKALDDSSLEVALWLPDRGAYADSRGEPTELPPDDESRGVTILEREGEPLAALIHDPALRDDPALVEAAGAAARLALENARLQAELRAQLHEVEKSRARIVAAGDAERRRLERNIHDGAQQRLVALALSLRVAQRTLGGEPEMAHVLQEAVGELQLAVEELRELARGLHPTILSEEGFRAALESLADRTPIPVVLELDSVDGALPPEAELSAYFVACEAVANAVKHAGASQIKIAVRQQNGTVTVEVTDDGSGGADPAGSGLRGLADRVAAHGGSLRVTSDLGYGTEVVAELPSSPYAAT